METKFVTEKLTEILQILAEHYDVAVNENNIDLNSVHDKKREAQQKFEELEKDLSFDIKESLSNLIGAYDEENNLMSKYAFMEGLKCGIQFAEWVHADDEPLFFEKVFDRDYAERILHLNK